MARTDTDIDEEACVELMRWYPLAIKMETINFALKIAAAESLSLSEAKQLRGSGCDGYLDKLRKNKAV